MKKLLAFITILLSLNSLASVTTGSLISSNRFNNSTFQIGDIKHSILTQAQFQTIHGSCWLLMNGQSMIGKDLAILTGMNAVPDARGQFLRSLDNGKGIDSNRVINSIQADEIKSHAHTQSAHNHLQGYGRANGYGYADQSLYGTTIVGTGQVAAEAGGSYTRRYAYTSSSTPEISPSGGLETRPKNIAVNLFIKVHNDCN